MDTLLERQNCEMEIKFFFMLCTQRTLLKCKGSARSYERSGTSVSNRETRAITDHNVVETCVRCMKG